MDMIYINTLLMSSTTLTCVLALQSILYIYYVVEINNKTNKRIKMDIVNLYKQVDGCNKQLEQINMLINAKNIVNNNVNNTNIDNINDVNNTNIDIDNNVNLTMDDSDSEIVNINNNNGAIDDSNNVIKQEITIKESEPITKTSETNNIIITSKSINENFVITKTTDINGIYINSDNIIDYDNQLPIKSHTIHFNSTIPSTLPLYNSNLYTYNNVQNIDNKKDDDDDDDDIIQVSANKLMPEVVWFLNVKKILGV